MNAPETHTDQHDPITQSMMKTLRLQRDDFTAEGHVSAQVRIDRLSRGIAAVAKHQDRLVEAMNADFSCRPRELSLLTDIAGSITPMKTAAMPRLSTSNRSSI
jgi:coniferyl-aldehyde dehydrogenase